MPRSSSSSRTGPTRKIVSVQKRTVASTSSTVSPAASPAPTIIAERPTFGQAVKEGFGWGVGTSIARSLFGGGGGGSITQTVEHIHTGPVAPKNPEYEQCMKESSNDAEACKQYLNQSKSQ